MKKYDLYLCDSVGTKKLVAVFDDLNESLNIVSKIAKELSYEVPYIRFYSINNDTYFDIGEWSEFFVLKGVDLAKERGLK